MTARYHRPTTLDEALLLLRSNDDAMILAGGTDVYPTQTGGAVWRTTHVSRPVIDITNIGSLRGIEDRGDYWWIGATTTWSDIAEARTLPPLFDGLKDAARDIGGIQIQNQGTIAGNLCTASPAGDSVPCLLALDAEVECAGGTDFRVPLSNFITGYRKTILEGELVTGVRIPRAKGCGHFRKLGARRYLVISIAMVSGVFDLDPATGYIHEARIAVGACSAVAQRLPPLETRLTGTVIGQIMPTADDLAHLTPIDDVRASADYRRAAALQLVADLITDVERSTRQAA